MDRRRTVLVDAFTTTPLSGNPAGIVPNASGLDVDQMAAIANELGAPESAFVTESEVADRRLRYFTPTGEIDLCGHATVAVHAHLLDDGAIGPGTYSVETNAGVFDVNVRQDGVVWIGMAEPDVRNVEVDESRVADALGVTAHAVVTGELPIAVASTGVPFLIVPVDFLATLGGMEPDHGAIEELTEEFEATGVYAFTFDTLDRESTLQGRMFAPAAGIPEDPATGTASGAVGAYLRAVDAFEEMPDELFFEQGHYLDRPGVIRVRVNPEIRIGGEATTSLDGELVVPESDDDGIIEA